MKLVQCQVHILDPITGHNRTLPQVFDSLTAAVRAAAPLAASLSVDNKEGNAPKTVRIEPVNSTALISRLISKIASAPREAY